MFPLSEMMKIDRLIFGASHRDMISADVTFATDHNLKERSRTIE